MPPSPPPTPALCLLSPVITAVPLNHPLTFLLCKIHFWFDFCFCFFVFSIVPHQSNVKYWRWSCQSDRRCVNIKANFKRKNGQYKWAVLMHVALCHLVQKQTEVIGAPCEQISVLFKTEQYRTVWIHLSLFYLIILFCFVFYKGPHDMYVSLLVWPL